MFEGIIPKEYPTDHIDCMDAVVISQQNLAKDSEDKKLVQADLLKSTDSRESRQGYVEIPSQCQKVTQYLKGEDEMEKVEYLEKFQVQHLDPRVTAGVQEEAPQMIFQMEEWKRHWVNLMVQP